MPKQDSFPRLARIEWRLARYKAARLLINCFCHLPRFIWYFLKYHLRSQARLSRFERQVFSQNGEDGIIEEVFRRIGEGAKYALEFGISNGEECCTRNLLWNKGWTGLLIEGSARLAEKARALYGDLPRVRVVQAFVMKDTIVELFKANAVPHEPDLLVVDIDGNDYWVLQSILEFYKPRVILVEYNARWTPATDWTMPYEPSHTHDGTAYFGASLAAFVRLGNQHGYTLVGCESCGVNAFFMRDDQVGEHFPDHQRAIGYHFAPPLYAWFSFGHPIRLAK